MNQLKKHPAYFFFVFLFSICGSASSAILDNSVLMFDAGVESCLYGGAFPNCDDPFSGTVPVSGVSAGSWFGVDAQDGIIDDSEKVAISPYRGLITGAVQDASGSHAGAPDGSESPSIDQPWLFFGNTGMHQTTSPVTVVSGGNGTYQLDFSGWGVDFNGQNVPLGGDPTVVGDGGSISNGTGLATISCSTLDCAIGSSFVLDYQVNIGDVVNGTFSLYVLHLEGRVSAVPLPAVIWLFLSGLLALSGFSRYLKYS